MGRPATPKDHRSEPSARLSALRAHHRRPPASLGLSEEMPRVTDARLRALRERARSDRVSPSSSEELSGGVCHRHRAPCAQPARQVRACPTPKGRAARPATDRPLKTLLPNVRATSGLRRARRRGAERSERLRLSLSPTPGHVLEPEGSSSRQGCRVRTHGAVSMRPATLAMTPKNHVSRNHRQHSRTF